MGKNLSCVGNHDHKKAEGREAVSAKFFYSIDRVFFSLIHLVPLGHEIEWGVLQSNEG